MENDCRANPRARRSPELPPHGDCGALGLQNVYTVWTHRGLVPESQKVTIPPRAATALKTEMRAPHDAAPVRDTRSSGGGPPTGRTVFSPRGFSPVLRSSISSPHRVLPAHPCPLPNPGTLRYTEAVQSSAGPSSPSPAVPSQGGRAVPTSGHSYNADPSAHPHIRRCMGRRGSRPWQVEPRVTRDDG